MSAGRRQQPSSSAFRVDERQRPQVEVLDAEQIEGEEGDRVLHRRPADVERAPEPCPLLEPLKAGPPGLVEGHDLAVEQQPVERQRGHRANHLGKCVEQVVAVPGEQPRRRRLRAASSRYPSSLSSNSQPGSRERLVARLRQHQLDGLRAATGSRARRAASSSARIAVGRVRPPRGPRP